MTVELGRVLEIAHMCRLLNDVHFRSINLALHCERDGRRGQNIMFADLPETGAPFALAEAMQASYAAAVRRMAEARGVASIDDLIERLAAAIPSLPPDRQAEVRATIARRRRSTA